jgi:hypothetical protein
MEYIVREDEVDRDGKSLGTQIVPLDDGKFELSKAKCI